jgi:hypothetical protein
MTPPTLITCFCPVGNRPQLASLSDLSLFDLLSHSFATRLRIAGIREPMKLMRVMVVKFAQILVGKPPYNAERSVLLTMLV